MARSRRESHHNDGITDPARLQQTSATKSAQSGHLDCAEGCLLSGVKRTSPFDRVMSAYDPYETLPECSRTAPELTLAPTASSAAWHY
jgi:hypothetical protein